MFFVLGLNQLLWYYAEMEKKRCTTGSAVGAAANGTVVDPDACIVWRRFAKYVSLHCHNRAKWYELYL